MIVVAVSSHPIAQQLHQLRDHDVAKTLGYQPSIDRHIELPTILDCSNGKYYDNSFYVELYSLNFVVVIDGVGRALSRPGHWPVRHL